MTRRGITLHLLRCAAAGCTCYSFTLFHCTIHIASVLLISRRVSLIQRRVCTVAYTSACHVNLARFHHDGRRRRTHPAERKSWRIINFRRSIITNDEVQSFTRQGDESEKSPFAVSLCAGPSQRSPS